MKIIYVVCLFCSLFFLTKLSFSASCEDDHTIGGAWVDITARVPEGDCKGVPYIGLYKPVRNKAYIYFHGENNRYRVLTPVASSFTCLSGWEKDCDCNEAVAIAISRDAYKNCWGVTNDRNRGGASCQGYPHGETVAIMT